MIKRHQYVANDFSDEDTIWKYYSLPAFLALLETRKLFFTRADILSDPNEFPITAKDAAAFRMTPDDYSKTIQHIKQQTYINCWRLSNYESFGMWNAYADTATGIAIKTDVSSLFASENTATAITAGKVSYFDENKGMTQIPGFALNTYYIVFHKTIPYQNECELRLCYEKAGNDVKPESEGVSVDICKLIKEVYVGSAAKPYVVNTIEQLLNRYGINLNVKQSTIK